MTTDASTVQAATPLSTTSEGAPDSPPASEQPPAEAPSLESQIETLTAANEKLEGQRKADQRRAAKVRDESTSMQQLRDDMDDLRLEVSAIPELLSEGFKASASGNAEEISGALSATQERIRGEKDVQLRQSRYRGLKRRMEEFTDNAEAVSAWQAEVERQNGTEGTQSLDGFQEILEAARESQFTSQLAAKDTELAEMDTKLKTARADFEKEYEVGDVNIGPATGGGDVTITGENIDNLMSRIDEFSAEKQVAIRDKYRGLMTTGKFT